MTTQPEALRLAADLKLMGAESSLTRHQAAHELLRLHAKTVEADQVIEQRHAMISDLHALTQELANELKRLAADAESNIRSEYEGTKELTKKLKSLAPARAAIAKAGGVHG